VTNNYCAHLFFPCENEVVLGCCFCKWGMNSLDIICVLASRRVVEFVRQKGYGDEKVGGLKMKTQMIPPPMAWHFRSILGTCRVVLFWSSTTFFVFMQAKYLLKNQLARKKILVHIGNTNVHNHGVSCYTHTFVPVNYAHSGCVMDIKKLVCPLHSQNVDGRGPKWV